MAKTTENNLAKYTKPALVIVCGVLLLALIIVSAFAYQWHGENVQMKTTIATARAMADPDTIVTLNNSITDLQSDLNKANSKIADQEKLIREYEIILTENDLMPEPEVVEE